MLTFHSCQVFYTHMKRWNRYFLLTDKQLILINYYFILVTSYQCHMFGHQWMAISLNRQIFLWLFLKTALYLGSWQQRSRRSDIWVHTTVLTTHLNPRVKDIVLWLDRIHILAIVKMVSCYHDNWGCIKLFSKIMHLSKKYNVCQISS